MIVDDHEVSRAACRALLLAEGMDVVADLRAGDDVIAVTRALRPDVAIIDVTPASHEGIRIARALRESSAVPAVIVTSSTSRDRFGPELDGDQFIAKADICAAAIRRHLPTGSS